MNSYSFSLFTHFIYYFLYNRGNFVKIIAEMLFEERDRISLNHSWYNSRLLISRWQFLPVWNRSSNPPSIALNRHPLSWSKCDGWRCIDAIGMETTLEKKKHLSSRSRPSYVMIQSVPWLITHRKGYVGLAKDFVENYLLRQIFYLPPQAICLFSIFWRTF